MKLTISRPKNEQNFYHLEQTLNKMPSNDNRKNKSEDDSQKRHKNKFMLSILFFCFFLLLHSPVQSEGKHT